MPNLNFIKERGIKEFIEQQSKIYFERLMDDRKIYF